ncbi:hypothetical protein FB451DRAFT_1182940 [Mycena latifolia]|nr:hypothetical protein FB451DRAFT_1182940 [Mycena latifolia]
MKETQDVGRGRITTGREMKRVAEAGTHCEERVAGTYRHLARLPCQADERRPRRVRARRAPCTLSAARKGARGPRMVLKMGDAQCKKRARRGEGRPPRWWERYRVFRVRSSADGTARQFAVRWEGSRCASERTSRRVRRVASPDVQVEARLKASTVPGNTNQNTQTRSQANNRRDTKLTGHLPSSGARKFLTQFTLFSQPDSLPHGPRVEPWVPTLRGTPHPG